MKEKCKRVTFTIENGISNIINYFSEYYDISKSKFVSDCIEYSYQFMEEELKEKNDGIYDTFYQRSKKFPNTNPITLTLPQSVVDKLDYYSKEIGIKKSHIVKCSIIIWIEDKDKNFQNEIDDLMKTIGIKI